MNEENGSHETPPEDRYQPFGKIIWLPVALIPSVIAIGMLSLGVQSAGLWLLCFLIALNVLFSVAASVGFMRGLKDEAVQILGGLLLTALFFALNAGIVIFAGCACSGRGAP